MFLSWITRADHKRIGILYLTTSLIYFGVADLLTLGIRTQLVRPANDFVSAHAYAELFTLHGTAMIFLFVAPFAVGLVNFLLPLQIGAPDMVFPRLSATSYRMFLFGGLTIFAGAATNEGATANGWVSYAPLSEIKISTGLGQDVWIVGVFMVSIATILTAINFITTVRDRRLAQHTFAFAAGDGSSPHVRRFAALGVIAVLALGALFIVQALKRGKFNSGRTSGTAFGR